MHLSIGQAALFLGVAISTLRRWHADGKLVPQFCTVGGHRRYSLPDLHSYAGCTPSVSSKRINIAYARVSSSDQKEDLVRQQARLAEYCTTNFETFEAISDLGSGLKYNKPGLLKLIRLICRGQVANLVITHRDRLLRFGTQLIFTLCDFYGTKVSVIETEKAASYEEELSRDVIEIITVFSAKLYGRRSHQNRETRKAA